jgi:hypothetical protein
MGGGGRRRGFSSPCRRHHRLTYACVVVGREFANALEVQACVSLDIAQSNEHIWGLASSARHAQSQLPGTRVLLHTVLAGQTHPLPSWRRIYFDAARLYLGTRTFFLHAFINVLVCLRTAGGRQSTRGLLPARGQEAWCSVSRRRLPHQ